MNILFISNAYNVGGGEQNLLDVALELSKDNNVFICIPHEGDFSRKLSEHKIPHLLYGMDFSFERRWFGFVPLFIELKSFLRIRKMLNQQNFIPDVIHSNTLVTVPLAFILRKYYNVELFWTCHGPWEVVNGMKARVVSFLSTRTIAITPEIYEMCNIKNKVMIPLGIKDDVSFFAKVCEDRKTKRILCVGRFQYIKGQDLLVKAFNILEKRIDRVELHFMGSVISNKKKDFKYFEKVKHYVKTYDLSERVFFHGFIGNVRDCMQDFDIICIPSRYESFSIVALEAMKRGLLVVAPNIGGPSYIIENNKSGILYEAENIDDMASKLLDCLCGKIKLCPRDIYARADKFTIELQTKRLLEIYNDEKTNVADNSISTKF